MAATQRKTQAGSLAPLRARLPVVRPPAPSPPSASPESPPPPAPPLPASAPPRPPTAPELKPAAVADGPGRHAPDPGRHPPGAKLVFGRLVCQVAKNGRPLVGLEVPCQCRFHRHRSPWRGDWPVSRAVASFPLSVCPGRKGQAVWLALNPATLNEREATMRQARGVPGVAASPGRTPGPEGGRPRPTPR